MSLLGAIGSAIGEIFSKNQEEAAIKKAENAEARESAEVELNDSADALTQAAGSIFTQDELGANVFDEFGRDVGATADAFGDFFQAGVKNVLTDVATTLDDFNTDVGSAIKSTTESTQTVGFSFASGIANIFSQIGSWFSEGAEESLKK